MLEPHEDGLMKCHEVSFMRALRRSPPGCSLSQPDSTLARNLPPGGGLRNDTAHSSFSVSQSESEGSLV